MQILRAIAAIAFVSFVLFPFPTLTLAQQTPPQQSGAQRSLVQQTELSDSQLRSFAKTYVQIEKIFKSYEPKMEEAKTPEEGKQIQNEEKSKVDQALTQGGMDAQSYHRIIEIANADDGLRKKIIGFINEERRNS